MFSWCIQCAAAMASADLQHQMQQQQQVISMLPFLGPNQLQQLQAQLLLQNQVSCPLCLSMFCKIVFSGQTQSLFVPNIFTQGLQNLATAQGLLGSPVSKGSIPSPSAPSPTLTGTKHRSDSPKSPTSTLAANLHHFHHSQSNAHMPMSLPQHLQHHLANQSVPITSSSLMQSMNTHSNSNVHPMFESSPKHSRMENYHSHRASPAVPFQQQPLHHHQGHKNLHLNTSLMDKLSVESNNGKFFLDNNGPNGLSGPINRSSNSSPACQAQQTTTQQQPQPTPHLTKSAATAPLPGTRPSDLNADEITDLEELEQFAKTFKQRRIKLGKCSHSLGGGVNLLIACKAWSRSVLIN